MGTGSEKDNGDISMEEKNNPPVPLSSILNSKMSPMETGKLKTVPKSMQFLQNHISRTIL